MSRRLQKGSIPRYWFFRSFLILIVVLSVLLLIGWKTVLSYLGDFLVSPQSPQRADIILVLGGDFWGPRVVKAADLAVEGYAPVVLFSGIMYQRRPEGEAAIRFLAERGYRVDSFEYFLHDARSTIDEAIALRGELARRGVKRVLLVTSAYHSRRASIVFRLYCPGIQFIAIGAPDEHYHPDNWWQDASSRKLFVSEWSKILATVLFVYPKHRIASYGLASATSRLGAWNNLSRSASGGICSMVTPSSISSQL